MILITIMITIIMITKYKVSIWRVKVAFHAHEGFITSVATLKKSTGGSAI